MLCFTPVAWASAACVNPAACRSEASRSAKPTSGSRARQLRHNSLGVPADPPAVAIVAPQSLRVGSATCHAWHSCGAIGGCDPDELWRGLLELALIEYRQVSELVELPEARLDALGKPNWTARSSRRSSAAAKTSSWMTSIRPSETLEASGKLLDSPTQQLIA